MTRLIRAFTLAALVGCGSGAAESSVDERPVVKAATVSEVVFGDDLKISATLSAHQVATGNAPWTTTVETTSATRGSTSASTSAS